MCRFLFSSPGRRERRRDLEGIYICINETVIVEILVVLLGLSEKSYKCLYDIDEIGQNN